MTRFPDENDAGYPRGQERRYLPAGEPDEPYMGIACDECLAEFVADDWGEAVYAMYLHALQEHDAIAALGFTCVAEGRCYPYDIERGLLSTLQEVRLEQWDAILDRLVPALEATRQERAGARPALAAPQLAKAA